MRIRALSTAVTGLLLAVSAYPSPATAAPAIGIYACQVAHVTSIDVTRDEITEKRSLDPNSGWFHLAIGRTEITFLAYPVGDPTKAKSEDWVHSIPIQGRSMNSVKASYDGEDRDGLLSIVLYQDGRFLQTFIDGEQTRGHQVFGSCEQLL